MLVTTTIIGDFI